VVVLTGAGERAFSTGADMKGGSGSSGLEYWATPRPGGFGGIALRDTLDVPVIARVNGHALGGGMEMMLGCDIVVASANATFGLPEPRVGRLALDGGIATLTRRIPHVQAMGMLLTGRRIGAAEALRFGLVNEVVAIEELDDAVARWVADILACAPLSVRAIKQMVRAGERLSAKEAQMLRLPALVEALQSFDQEEGVRAFQEKRAPQWRGR
jgi:enoyl-CoA hydratase/carnithine racemase